MTSNARLYVMDERLNIISGSVRNSSAMNIYAFEAKWTSA